MNNLEQLYEVILTDYMSYCKVNNREPQLFICSPQLRAEFKDTVLGLPIEVDDTLYGFTNSAWYWL